MQRLQMRYCTLIKGLWRFKALLWGNGAQALPPISPPARLLLDLQTSLFCRRTELRSAAAAVSLLPGLFEMLRDFAHKNFYDGGTFLTALLPRRRLPHKEKMTLKGQHFIISPDNAVVMVGKKTVGRELLSTRF